LKTFNFTTMKSINPYLMAITLFLSGCSAGAPPEQTHKSSGTESLIPVRTAPVERQDVIVPIYTSGTVTTENDARPAFKTGGVISRILVKEGDQVRQGQLLATLDLTEINAQVQQAVAAVAKSQRDLQRINNLHADSVATLEQVQDASTGLTIAEQSLEMARFNQSYSEIRAPFSGKVVRQLMNEGEVAGPGNPVFYLLSNARQDWVVTAGLSDRDWARLQVGDRAEIRLDAYPDQQFPARVSQLADVGNPLSGTFDAEFTFTGPTPRLAVGLIASVTVFPRQNGPQTTIPVDALVESNGKDAVVYILNGDSCVHRVTVTVGQLYQDRAIVLSGLEDAAAVVTTGAPYLEEGRRVRVVN